MIRTIEDVLGIGYLNLNDAYQRPMTSVFDLSQVGWTYTAVTPSPMNAALAAPLQGALPGAAFQDATPGRLLGAADSRLRLVHRGSCSGGAVQQDSLEGTDRRPELPPPPVTAWTTPVIAQPS